MPTAKPWPRSAGFRSVHRGVAVAAAALLVAGCSGGSDPRADGAEAESRPLCVTSACGQKTVLARVPDAENLLLTPDNRVFVSGGTNVFEVRGPVDDVSLTPLFGGECNFTGLAQRGQVLYAICATTQQLYAAHLDPAPTLVPIHDLLGFGLPNGLETGPAGELYVTDGPVPATPQLPDPKIVVLQFDPADPMSVVSQSTWTTDGLEFPNGLARIGNTLYVADARAVPPEPGAVRRIEIGADGTAGPTHTHYVHDGILDDLSVFGDGLLVSDFQNGTVFQLDADGNNIGGTDMGTFASASSVQFVGGAAPAGPGILVTEKGTLGDTESDIGNVLSVFRAAD